MIVQVGACGICGSDLRAYRHGLRVDLPSQILGHEVAGTIVHVGKNVCGYTVGQRLAIAADIHCGKCYYCMRALFHLCLHQRILGQQVAGGIAEYIELTPDIIQNGVIHPTPDNLIDAEAALAEPASSVINNQERIGIGLGQTVVVIGAGTIGCMHVAIAKARGASVILANRSDPRLELARRFGADVYLNSTRDEIGKVVRERTEGIGADAVIVAVPSAEAQAEALDLVRKRGTLVLFGGLPRSEPYVRLHANKIHYDEINVTGAFSYHPDHHKLALSLFSSGAVCARDFITHRYPLEATREAFATLENECTLKVMIEPPA